MNLKKILGVLGIVLIVTLFISAPWASAAGDGTYLVDLTNKEEIALFIQLDPNGVGKPGEISERIFDSVSAKLKGAKKVPIPYIKAQKDLRVYLRDNDNSENQREQDKGVILKSKDFKALGNIEGVRYVMLVTSRITSVEEKENFWTIRRKNLTILSTIVIYDLQAEDYLMDEEYATVGKTSGSYDRAYSRAINTLLEQIDFQQYFR